ncbi:hypothetical protein AB1Y20_010610 [Prymnesium parvum]|uniref:Cilia- and flagella-associated protein 58 central coiled coil domain-containing protein n=1 Tax=Prymnesium parvum TaxID=97485 RepID=A0AB34IP63_PRYPA
MEGDSTKKDEVPGFEAGAFESLESDFQEVLQELVGDKSLERFRVEYDKLHRALKKSHESEKRLIKKCRELNQEIVANAAKVQTALKLSQEDQNTISSLKREIEKAWKMVDAAHDKETRAKETIQQLKHEIQNLSRLVEQGAGLSIGQENTVNELIKVKTELAKERDAQASLIQGLKAEVAHFMGKINGLDKDIALANDEIMNLKEVISLKKAEAEKEGAKKEQLEKGLKLLRQTLESRQNQLREKAAAMAKMTDNITKQELALREERGRTDKSGKETDFIGLKITKLEHELDDSMHTAQAMNTELKQKGIELKLRKEEMKRATSEAQRLKKMVAVYQKKLAQTVSLKEVDEEQREELRENVRKLDITLEQARSDHEAEKRTLDKLLRERDILNKQLLLSAATNQKQSDQVKVHENTRRNLEQEIAGYKAEGHKQRKMIFLLEKDGQKYGAEAADASTKWSQALEEIKVRELSIIQLQKRISEGDAKLKQQQSLYESVRSDRNLYSKNLIESQEEIAEMKRKFRIMNHQIEQLKEEIHAKDQALVKEHFERMKKEKEKENLRDQLAKIKAVQRKNEDFLAEFKADTAKLNMVINKADQERQRQRKETEIVVNERDILGTQLIRRNEELSLLYEKIRIQHSTLHKGERQYNARVREIKLLKRSIRELTTELSRIKGSVSNMETLRNEVYQLQRELLQERTKVRALSEELENPMNVHRWRKLEGSDPATYELVQKIHMLQKRLIEKSEEVVDKDLLIQHKEKLYIELKNILARQPGPEVAEQLAVYQQSLQERNKQMDLMNAELTLSQTQVNEYKYEIGRITKELREVKKKFFEQKRREQHAATTRRMERSTPAEVLVQEARASMNRFTGGGFNLNMTAG